MTVSLNKLKEENRKSKADDHISKNFILVSEYLCFPQILRYKRMTTRVLPLRYKLHIVSDLLLKFRIDWLLKIFTSHDPTPTFSVSCVGCRKAGDKGKREQG